MSRAGEPRWLDGEEEQAWMALVGVLLTLPTALDARMQRDSGMTLYEYVVLAALSRAPGRSRRMTDLAVVTNGSLPRLSQVVTKLERRGWVTRSKDPHDARSTLAHLSDEGWEVLVRAAPRHVEAVRRLVFDPLTPTQVRQMRSIHQRIKAAIAPESPVLG